MIITNFRYTFGIGNPTVPNELLVNLVPVIKFENLLAQPGLHVDLVGTSTKFSRNRPETGGEKS
eukprot:SAG31_NODE_6363_length_2042_cov_20.687597_4_plen_64_part_00